MNKDRQPNRIRVIVAEDSPTARAHLVATLQDDPAIEVVAEAADGTEAVDLTVALRPDCVVMDILMPGFNGFEATELVMDRAPTPIIIVSAALDVREAEIATKALRAGAAAVMPKPAGPGAPDAEWASRQFVETVKALGRVKVRRRPRPRAAGMATVKPGTVSQEEASAQPVIAMVAGRGGPTVLVQLLGSLPDAISAPIFIVQHLPSAYLPRLAETLDAALRREVRIPSDGERLRPGKVYLAPSGAHMGVRDRETVRVPASAPIDGFRPSATYLFRSVGRVFGRGACAVVLTGLGIDGVAGLQELRRAGGFVLAQEPDTAAEPRLPLEVIKRDLADLVLPPEAMPAVIEEVCRGSRPRTAAEGRSQRASA